ncbi:MAG: ABC transporter ATP-binding protein [Candidatus Competibacter denitrificans]|jgi:putative ABC transport system ATP-binding protein|uniref:ABC transporter related protein n=1 Tax=Candidatus Competibacter denitrificans Run_A_D11 TaxID=1400863 RepID=W6MB27_9GAMM|nr:ABC transporter ATP-binding protein [Candidatus Competibacter denitrificans]CDI04054.1 ABC transporter related protein [Candidatus Competibacter denitrificans Run_A_D11]HCK80654.1 ABC transporter ATP-binding protein [Candidatus Competibacteraceae bacterium]HRC70360.1 ABC transporter ATP-binding protein [Candidatus Competibacter denitrificans]
MAEKTGGGANAAQPTFVARALTKTYRTEAGEVHALRGIDLELWPGEFVVMLGPSGSGKSTFLNILGGLDSPTAGQVLYRGADLAAFSERARTRYRREEIGFVFQFYNLIPSLTARENVLLATEIAPEPLTPEAALDLVGLSARADHFPAEMSGGEQQRVAVARAIAKRPSILLCDEPTGALDSNTGILVLQAIEAASSALKTTTVLITHNVSIAAMGDRVISFTNGHIADIRLNAQRRPAGELSW